MVISKPPACWTARRGWRLRLPFGAALPAALALVVAAAAPALARGVPLRVLVAAPVSEPARATLSPALWSHYVAGYIGSSATPIFGPAEATLDDCRRARADYLLTAPFDLRPRLPGLANAAGRVAGRAHVVVANCLTGNVLFEQTINFDSEPPSSAAEGDFDNVPEMTWGRSIPATLSRYPVVFERIARVISILSPLARIERRSGVPMHPGDVLRDVASADRKRRTAPILLTVTQIYELYAEAIFSTSAGEPAIGDLVEPVPQSPPTTGS